jgi:hypothetical protein
MWVGKAVVQRNVATTEKPVESVIIGFDGGYLRNWHRQDEWHFEVIAGKRSFVAVPASLESAAAGFLNFLFIFVRHK